jgi:predicted RNA-binding Zn ribbon-like protein
MSISKRGAPPVRLAELQGEGFPMGAEPLVALDLVDTIITVADPPIDLMADPAQAATWWHLQASRLPDGPPPDLAATRRLRTAIRDLFDAQLEHREPRATSIEDVNAAAAAAPISLRLGGDANTLHTETRWHTELGGNAALAAVATEAITLLTQPDQRKMLRRCANPNCSMLFLAQTTRRQWCTQNICGNRTRVARHYQRTRLQPGSAPE